MVLVVNGAQNKSSLRTRRRPWEITIEGLGLRIDGTGLYDEAQSEEHKCEFHYRYVNLSE